VREARDEAVTTAQEAAEDAEMTVESAEALAQGASEAS
jgi:hypothetical protein